jgi:hypothetical protein
MKDSTVTRIAIIGFVTYVFYKCYRKVLDKVNNYLDK